MRTPISVGLATAEATGLVRERFEERGIIPLDVAVRDYPDETIFVVFVEMDDVSNAASVGNELDDELASRGYKGFVTVRRGELKTAEAQRRRVVGVHDDRATELVRLVAARSRTSEVQPSLAYVPDVAANISAATAPRHNLVVGRRGAGKTALLVEAKRLITADDHLSVG